MSLNKFIKIGSRIKNIRKSKGISQKEMAEIYLKIPRSTYSNYENDNRVPDNDTLKKITDVLGVRIEKLISTKEEFNFNYNNIINSTYDIFEEVYNYSRVKEEIGFTAKKFVNKDKYFIDELANNFIKIILVNSETLKNRILNNDNTPIDNPINIKYAPNSIENNKDGLETEIANTFKLGNKLNNKNYLEFMIEKYKKYLTNVKNGINNYEVMEEGLKKAKNKYNESSNEKKEDTTRKATQRDIDKLLS